MSDQTIRSIQNDTNSLYEEKLGKIKGEFQATVSGIQSAMILAISNFDKKCDDYESLLVQLNAERKKSKLLEEQVEHLKNTLKEKDDDILKLQLSNNQTHGRYEEPKSIMIDQSKEDIAETNDIIRAHYNVSRKNLRKISESMAHGKISTTKNVSSGIQLKEKTEKQIYYNQKFQVHDHLKYKHIPVSNVKKTNGNCLKIELKRIIDENKSIITGLKAVQQT